MNQAHRSGGIECKGLEIQPIRGKELECVNQSEPSSRHATRGIKGVRLHFSVFPTTTAVLIARRFVREIAELSKNTSVASRG